MKQTYTSTYTFLFGLIILLLCCPTAQASGDNGKYPFPFLSFHREPCAEWQGDDLMLDFACYMPGRIRGPESIHLIPLYIAGRDTIRYPELSYYTPSGARFYKRNSSLLTMQRKTLVRVLRRGSSSECNYRERRLVPYSKRGEFHLLHVISDCCGYYVVSCDTIPVPERTDIAYSYTPSNLPRLQATVSYPLYETNVSFIRPQVEEVKERTASATIRITYPQNHWKVYPDFENNRQELAKIDQLLAPVANDTVTYQVQSASIVGYASPEDAFYHNLELSKKRANAMREYIQNRYHLPYGKLTSEGLGEDWVGLRKAVVASNMQDKEDILDIIDYVDIFNGRERELIRLHDGRPYKYMLRKLFPPLRRIEMQINYRVRPFRRDEARALIDSRPQDLSLREMYDVARSENSNQTIVRRRDDYGHEYDIAVRYFPQNDIANINAASAALVRGDMEQAWVCLSRVIDDPRAYNNLGVYYWMCGLTDEARSYFEKARSVEPQLAEYNLEQLRKWENSFNRR